VLILDDATSSVDASTEEGIHGTLRRLMEGRTTLLVAHRRSTLRLADRIAVVDRGVVVDDGTHEELLARNVQYRRLVAGPGEGAEGEAELEEPVAPAPLVVPSPTPATAGVGGRPGGMAGPGGRPGGMEGVMLAPTPELMAAVEALPPADHRPEVDVERESAEDPRFGFGRFVRPFRRQLGVGVGLVLVDTILTVLGPVLVKVGIDQGVVNHSLLALAMATLVYLVVVLADWVDTWGEIRYTGRTAERLLFGLRVRIFSHLQRLALDFYEREMAGRIMTRMTTDVESLSQLLQTGLVNALVNLFSFVGVGIALIVMDARLSVVTFAVLPPLLAGTWWFRQRSRRAYDQARERIAVVNANFQENLSGVRVAQAYVQEGRNEQTFRQVSGDYLGTRVGAQRLVAIYFPFVLLLSDVATALVLGAGAYLVGHHNLSAGVLIAFLLYLDQLFSPIQQLSQTFDQWQQARASMVKISELMRIPVSTPEADHAIHPGRLEGSVRFESVRFGYQGSRVEALRGVDLDIDPGETVALVGETGAGKSTVVKLLARFYDVTGGRILIDGLPLPELDLAAYRAQLGYVPQEPFLFSGTIRDNIAYGRPSASDAEVETAARAVGAHELVVSLPGGYDYLVSERGRALSAGQRQLIALARARLVDPAILVLDEATSNLDLSTEARVARAMARVARGRTTLLIAHRLPTARSADRIVVMHDGRVVEQGRHDELLARGGRYAGMWAAFDVEPVAG
jgi:ATP-binding cassette subfamily B protein